MRAVAWFEGEEWDGRGDGEGSGWGMMWRRVRMQMVVSTREQTLRHCNGYFGQVPVHVPQLTSVSDLVQTACQVGPAPRSPSNSSSSRLSFPRSATTFFYLPAKLLTFFYVLAELFMLLSLPKVVPKTVLLSLAPLWAKKES